MLEKIIIIRNIFYKCFLISLVYFIFVSFIYLFYKDWAVNLTAGLYNVDKKDMYLLILYFMGWMKMIIFNLFLVPALAFHWTAYELKKEQK